MQGFFYGCQFNDDLISQSHEGVCRGIHYQRRFPIAHLVTILKGKIFDVGVDLRLSSETFGCAEGVELSVSNAFGQVFWPVGVAHGFVAIDEYNLMSYKCTGNYLPEMISGIIFDDPKLNIPWPLAPTIISKRDRNFPKFEELGPDPLDLRA